MHALRRVEAVSGAMPFAHTPFDGSHPAFRIGLAPLDLADWIEADGRLDEFLEQKEALFAQFGERILRAEPGTQAAQAEVLDLLADHLPARFPAIYRRDGDVMGIGASRRVRLADPVRQPLAIAASLVQEDLVLMRRGETGWRLAAASLHFPSSWSLAEKFSRPLDEIHKPVPGFGPGSRNASLMARIFDNLAVERPVWRLNWSLYSDGQLWHGDRTSEHAAKKAATHAARMFLRIEYQTLRRLERSGDILFTIRIHADPLAAISRHPDRAALCEKLAAALESLEPAQLAYKGMAESRDRLAAEIRAMASA